MKLPVRTLVVLALLSGPTTPAAASPLELHRGVGLHEWLNWSPINADGTYVWPPYRTVDQWLAVDRPATDWPPGDQFTRIRQLGFDFVRLSVDPGPLLATEGTKRQDPLDILKTDAAMLTAAGLKVVLNLQAVSQVRAYSMDMVNAGSGSDAVARYRQMSVDVARMLTALGTDKVAIEPFNEPAYYPCDTGGHGDWQIVMDDAVKAIRSVAPDLTIVATGACGGSVDGLTDLDPTFDDPDVLYSFHMYDPHSFTHQRLDDPNLFGSGLPWPPSAGTPQSVVAALQAHMQAAGLDDGARQANLSVVRPYIDDYFNRNWGEAQLAQRFADAAAWAKAHNIPTSRLFMGEFGAILMSDDGRSGAADADRLRYLTDVRTQADIYGIPWSIWEYSNPYGMTVIVPKGPAVPDPELLAALGLDQ
jgi:endoglucanase